MWRDRKSLLPREFKNLNNLTVEKPDKFIDLSLNGNASHLITGDNDLLVLNPIENTSVINPRNFWEEIFHGSIT